MERLAPLLFHLANERVNPGLNREIHLLPQMLIWNHGLRGLNEIQRHSGRLAIGSVVISLDYFKRFVAGLKGIVGGRIGVYEPLLERARREALIRMKSEAQALGHDAIINVRIPDRLVRRRRDELGVA